MSVTGGTVIWILPWPRSWSIYPNSIFKTLLVSDLSIYVISFALLNMLFCLINLIDTPFEVLGLELDIQFFHFISKFFLLIFFPLLSQTKLFLLFFWLVFSEGLEFFHPFGFLDIMLLISLLQIFNLFVEFGYLLLPVQMILRHPLHILYRALLHFRPLRNRVKQSLVHQVISAVLLVRLIQIWVFHLVIYPRCFLLLFYWNLSQRLGSRKSSRIIKLVLVVQSL